MIRFATLFLILGLSTSAWAIEPPTFVKLKDWRFPSFSKERGIAIETTAVFYNPNKRGRLKLREIALDVYAGETYLGTINQTEQKVKIRPKSAFEIPLRIDVQPKAGVFNNLFSLVTGQNLVLYIKGYVKITALFFRVKVKVDEAQEFSLISILNSK